MKTESIKYFDLDKRENLFATVFRFDNFFCYGLVQKRTFIYYVLQFKERTIEGCVFRPFADLAAFHVRLRTTDKR